VGITSTFTRLLTLIIKNLPTHQYWTLRLGDGDIFAGQVFNAWRREQHGCTPFALTAGT
jgi:hypothetical protein